VSVSLYVYFLVLHPLMRQTGFSPVRQKDISHRAQDRDQLLAAPLHHGTVPCQSDEHSFHSVPVLFFPVEEQVFPVLWLLKKKRYRRNGFFINSLNYGRNEADGSLGFRCTPPTFHSQMFMYNGNVLCDSTFEWPRN